MKIVLVQFSPARDDRAASRARIASLLAESEGDWFVLPEMALSGFTMNLGESTWNEDDFRFFEGLAREKQAFVTVGGVRERKNCAFTFGRDGALASVYEKRHLFSISSEDSNYRPGTGVETFELTGPRERKRVDDEAEGLAEGARGGEASAGERIRVGPSICYDLRFPYHFWKQAPEAELYFVIAAWPRSRRDHWRTLLAARAIENQAYVLATNRVGSGGGLDYAGGTIAVGPFGEILAEAGAGEEKIEVGAFDEADLEGTQTGTQSPLMDLVDAGKEFLVEEKRGKMGGQFRAVFRFDGLKGLVGP